MNCQFREDGKVVAEMERSLWRETAELELDDGSYSLYRDQVIGGDYMLERKGQILARATKPSLCADRSRRRAIQTKRQAA